MNGRGLELMRAVYGAGLLLAPAGALSAVERVGLDRPALRMARVLGARQMLQAAVLATRPGPGWRLAGAAVDATHAASMLALARWCRESRHRRLAAREAGRAAALAVAEAAAGGASGARFASVRARCRGTRTRWSMA